MIETIFFNKDGNIVVDIKDAICFERIEYKQNGDIKKISMGVIGN